MHFLFLRSAHGLSFFSVVFHHEEHENLFQANPLRVLRVLRGEKTSPAKTLAAGSTTKSRKIYLKPIPFVPFVSFVVKKQPMKNAPPMGSTTKRRKIYLKPIPFVPLRVLRGEKTADEKSTAAGVPHEEHEDHEDYFSPIPSCPSCPSW